MRRGLDAEFAQNHLGRAQRRAAPAQEAVQRRKFGHDALQRLRVLKPGRDVRGQIRAVGLLLQQLGKNPLVENEVGQADMFHTHHAPRQRKGQPREFVGNDGRRAQKRCLERGRARGREQQAAATHSRIAIVGREYLDRDVRWPERAQFLFADRRRAQ